MSKKNTRVTIFPNYHVANENRSVLLQPFDSILTNQGNPHLKRIAFLYFSQFFESPEAFKDDGITIEEDRLIISPMKLSQRTVDQSPSRFSGMIENLQNAIIASRSSRKEINRGSSSSELQVLTPKGAAHAVYNHINENYFNLIEITPADQRKLTGKGDDFKKQVVMMIETVKMNNDFTVEIRMSPFMYAVRDHIKKQIINDTSAPFSDPDYVAIDINELKGFRSPYAIQLYIRIAREQYISNSLTIGVDELASYLGWSSGNRTDYSNKAFLKLLKQVCEDPGLSKSTCAITPVTSSRDKNKKQYWLVAKRDKKKTTHIELRFKNNEELQQMLMDLPYGFIRHLTESDLNKATTIQIIKRVYDGIIEDKYVNYCVNKAYIYLERNLRPGKVFEGKGIGRLVWDYIKKGDYRDEYSTREELWDVSQPIGMSITKYRKDHQQPELPLKDVVQKKKASSNDEASFWSYIESKFSADEAAYVDYAKRNFSFEILSKRLNQESDVVKSVKAQVLHDFTLVYKKKLHNYIQDLGFDSKKVDILLKLMDDQTLATLFSFLNESQLDLPTSKDWKHVLTKAFQEQLTRSYL